MRNKTAKETSLALLSVSEMDTTPIIIQTDNGGEFKSAYNKVCKELEIKHIFSKSYSPNQNAIVERKKQRHS